MKPCNFPLTVLILGVMIMTVSCAAEQEKPAVLPSPSALELGNGTFTFCQETVISVECQQQKEIAEWFAWLFARPAGFVPKVFLDVEDADVVLRTTSSLGSEAYKISSGRGRIVIEASEPAGFFYAFQTLRQCLPASISATSHADGLIWTVPAMEIYDAPRFSHRCLKIDVSDNFVPVEELMTFVEYMSMLKLNHLHLSGYGRYLEDDIDMLVSHASDFHVKVVCGEGRAAHLYSCPDDIASCVFPSVAALAEVAWSDKEIMDKIGFNRAVDAIDAYLRQSVLGCSKSIYDIGLAELR